MPVQLTIEDELLDDVEIMQMPTRIERFVRPEMQRHARRFRKAFVKQLKSIKFESKQGINAMIRSPIIGKAMHSYFSGRKLDSFQILSRANAFIVPYILGGKVNKVPVAFRSIDKLFLRKPEEIVDIPWDRSFKRAKPSAARRKRTVTIKPKIKFDGMWDTMQVELIERISNATERAMKTSFKLNERKKRSG